MDGDELQHVMSVFISEVRRPTGDQYLPESIYYLCLGMFKKKDITILLTRLSLCLLSRYGWLLCCLARTTIVLCLNLGAVRQGMNSDKSLTDVCLGSPRRMHTDYV